MMAILAARAGYFTASCPPAPLPPPRPAPLPGGRLGRKRTAPQSSGGQQGPPHPPSGAGPGRGFLPRHDGDPGGAGRLFYRVVPRRAVAAGPGSAAAGPAGGIALVIQSLGVVA